jgi:hypothetical protein
MDPRACEATLVVPEESSSNPALKKRIHILKKLAAVFRVKVTEVQFDMPKG